ncbi:MAG: hypothetical protein JWN53_2526, partial [Gemmatimonadetes bacterium]|nr:hypothetical protein [Gemmatimonadota bacterium]
YDWYAPLAQRSDSTVASEIARKEKASMFDTYLLGELTMDAEAEAKAEVGQTVGIDFDPFLSGQDPCEHYETGKAIRRNGSYLVDILGVCAGHRIKKPLVVAELKPEDHSWVFVNFHYPRLHGNLLSVLRSLREQRGRNSHRVPAVGK